MFKTSVQAVLDFGLVPPPISIHKADSDLFAASWACLRETLVVGQVPRYFKEAVATGAANANKCPYCVGAHSMMYDIYKPKAKSVARGDEASGVLDTTVLSNWAQSCYAAESNRLVEPFPKSARAEIIGTAVFFHYLTRMVSVYLGDSFVPEKLAWSVPIMMPVMRLVMGLNDRRRKKLGASRLPDIPSDNGPAWADQDNVSVAFAQFGQVTEKKITRILDQPMIDFINNYLLTWKKPADSPGAGWVNTHLEDWSEQNPLQKQQAKFMLLVIGSPYMIIDSDKNALIEKMGDANFLIMTAWVALKAALRTGAIVSGGEAAPMDPASEQD